MPVDAEKFDQELKSLKIDRSSGAPPSGPKWATRWILTGVALMLLLLGWRLVDAWSAKAPPITIQQNARFFMCDPPAAGNNLVWTGKFLVCVKSEKRVGRSHYTGRMRRRDIAVGLNAVIVAVTKEIPRILTVRWEREAAEALPFGPLEPDKDRTLERGLRRWVLEQTGMELGYVEQLYTFADQFRDPTEAAGAPRSLSVAYLALVREVPLSGGTDAQWRDCYSLFPWEDRREGASRPVASAIQSSLDRWIETAKPPSARAGRRERCDITFGLRGAQWDAERVLERFELLYEAGFAPEAVRDRMRIRGRMTSATTATYASHGPGQPLALDHRRIVAAALGRLRAKLRYRPVVFELLPETFTLFQLQRVLESLAGLRLHKQNLRRLLEHGGLVEGTGERTSDTGGRPAELFRFRREVLRERPAPGVQLPRLGGPA